MLNITNLDSMGPVTAPSFTPLSLLDWPNFVTEAVLSATNSSMSGTSTSLLSLEANSAIEGDTNGPNVPERDPLSTVISMTILYALILVTGVIGNVSACIVIARNKYMRTATNYYLFSLAVSDLMLLILGLPQEMYQLWEPSPYVFGEVFCVVRGLTSEMSSNASVLTITAFTVERFLAICYPLRAHAMSKLSRVVRLIVIVWLTAALAAVPLALQFGLHYQIDEASGLIRPDTAQCTLKAPIRNAFEVSTFAFFAVPMTLILVLYMLIGIQLRRSEAMNRRCAAGGGGGGTVNTSAQGGELAMAAAMMAKSSTNGSGGGGGGGGGGRGQAGQPLTANGSTNGSVVVATAGGEGGASGGSYSKFKGRRSWEGRHAAMHGRPPGRGSQAPKPHSHSVSSRRAVIRMLIAVVVAFFVCWAPFHAQRLMAIHVTEPTQGEVLIFTVLTYISGVTYYVSATINPILYSIMSLKFRQAFKDTLGTCCGRTPDGPGRFGKFSSTTRGGVSSAGGGGSSVHSRYGPHYRHRDSDVTGTTSLGGSSLRSRTDSIQMLGGTHGQGPAPFNNCHERAPMLGEIYSHRTSFTTSNETEAGDLSALCDQGNASASCGGPSGSNLNGSRHFETIRVRTLRTSTSSSGDSGLSRDNSLDS